MDVCLSWMLCC